MNANAMRLSRRALIAALPGMAAVAARAQSPGGGPAPAVDLGDYPNRQVTFIVPFAPAGGTDVLTRLLAEKLQQRLNKPFVVENRPGAGTILATNFVAKSPPDGYTIMMAVSTLAIDVTLYKTLPFDPAQDLALISIVAKVPFVLVVNPALPVNNVEDLIKLAKERPLSYGSGGIGAFHHLAAALFASMAGIKMTHVPYRGSAPALEDLMGGYVQLMFSDLGPALPLINAKKIRPLAVTTKERLSALPDVPPLDEAGVPGYRRRRCRSSPSSTASSIPSSRRTTSSRAWETSACIRSAPARCRTCKNSCAPKSCAGARSSKPPASPTRSDRFVRRRAARRDRPPASGR
jgi:tripartite-type tricarboxylate transporter receptor subunit TctC